MPVICSANAFMARLFEHTGTGGPVNLRFARNPREAAIVDANGLIVMDALVDGDTASFDVMAHDLVNVRVTW